jgi:hypothetical protein
MPLIAMGIKNQQVPQLGKLYLKAAEQIFMTYLRGGPVPPRLIFQVMLHIIQKQFHAVHRTGHVRRQTT